MVGDHRRLLVGGRSGRPLGRGRSGRRIHGRRLRRSRRCRSRCRSKSGLGGESRWPWHALSGGSEGGGVVDLVELREERAELALVLADAVVEAFDLVLAALLVICELLGQLLAAALDLAIAFGHDALRLDLDPVADAGDIGLGPLTEVVGARRGPHAQRFDGRLDGAAQSGEARVALVVRNLAHGRDERDEEVVPVAGRGAIRGFRRRGGGGRGGLERLVGRGRGRHGRRLGRWLGRRVWCIGLLEIFVARPREPNATLPRGRGHLVLAPLRSCGWRWVPMLRRWYGRAGGDGSTGSARRDVPHRSLATIVPMIDSLHALGMALWASQAAAIALIAVVALVAWLVLRVATDRVARTILNRRASDSADPTALLTQIELERRVSTIQGLALRSGGAVLGIIAVLMALDVLGLNIGPAIAGLGVAGIAVGLGAQSLVRDWLAGIFVVLENQYSQGDVVRIAGVQGMVEDFSLRRTTLRDLDGTVHSVPNGQIVVASNLTRTWARVNLDIPVVHGTDIDAATAVINEVGSRLHDDPEWGPRLLEAPSVVRVSDVDDLGVTLKVLGQVRAAEQWAVAGELRKRVLAAFADRGIQIPTNRFVLSGLASAELAVEPPDPTAPS